MTCFLELNTGYFIHVLIKIYINLVFYLNSKLFKREESGILNKNSYKSIKNTHIKLKKSKDHINSNSLKKEKNV